jgi:hypothetical protein
MPVEKDAAELAGVLLPQEFVVFASRPHPVVFIRPVIATVIAFIATLATLTFRVRPIVHGHHVTISFFTTPNGAIALVLVGIFGIVALSKLMKAASYYQGFRCIATNRRVFIMRGIFGRSLQPIGNAATAGAGLVQGFFGRRYDFGTIYTNFGMRCTALRFAGVPWRRRRAHTIRYPR